MLTCCLRCLHPASPRARGQGLEPAALGDHGTGVGGRPAACGQRGGRGSEEGGVASGSWEDEKETPARLMAQPPACSGRCRQQRRGCHRPGQRIPEWEPDPSAAWGRRHPSPRCRVPSPRPWPLRTPLGPGRPRLPPCGALGWVCRERHAAPALAVVSPLHRLSGPSLRLQSLHLCSVLFKINSCGKTLPCPSLAWLRALHAARALREVVGLPGVCGGSCTRLCPPPASRGMTGERDGAPAPGVGPRSRPLHA